LNIAASCDLGGLGATEGPPVPYACVTGNLVPRLLPWLGILVLLLLRPNRLATAWWIWLPLAGLVGVTDGVLGCVGLFSSQTRDALGQIVTSLGFGLAAVWLLAPFLRRGHRFLTFLATGLALAGASLFAYGTQGGLGGGFPDTLPYLISMVVLAAVLTVALTMAGFHCRRGYRAVPFVGWVMGWLLLACSLAAAPFLLVAWTSSGGSVPVVQFFVPVLIVVGICLGVLLPFLILSTGNSLFRTRLRELLHVPDPS
jgi:hypothetical protein